MLGVKFYVALALVPLGLVVLPAESQHQTERFRDYEGELGREFREMLPRLPRFLKFDTTTEDLKIDLDFLIPIFKIPVKTTQDAMSGISKRMMTSGVTSMFLNGTTSLALSAIPAIMKALKYMRKSPSKTAKYSTSHMDNINGDSTIFESFLNTLGAVKNADIEPCMHLATCVLVQNSFRNYQNGRASGIEKFIDGVTGSEWILKQTEGSAFREAIEVGKSKYSCKTKFRTCKIDQRTLARFLNPS